MKIVGNAYYKKEQFVKAHSKYKKALRYLNKYQVLTTLINISYADVFLYWNFKFPQYSEWIRIIYIRLCIWQDLSGELAPHDEVALTQAVLPNLLNSAACKVKLKMYDQALEDCNEILDTSPNHPKAFYRRGQAYHGKRDYERAIVSKYEKIFTLDMIDSSWVLPWPTIFGEDDKSVLFLIFTSTERLGEGE